MGVNVVVSTWCALSSRERSGVLSSSGARIGVATFGDLGVDFRQRTLCVAFGIAHGALRVSPPTGRVVASQMDPDAS